MLFYIDFDPRLLILDFWFSILETRFSILDQSIRGCDLRFASGPLRILRSTGAHQQYGQAPRKRQGSFFFVTRPHEIKTMCEGARRAHTQTPPKPLETCCYGRFRRDSDHLYRYGVQLLRRTRFLHSVRWARLKDRRCVQGYPRNGSGLAFPPQSAGLGEE